MVLVHDTLSHCALEVMVLVHDTSSVCALQMYEVSLFDLILYVHSKIFQLCGTVLPGFNQY